MIDQEKRNKLIPKFSFLNDFGKDISFCISNEVNFSESEEQKNWVLLQAGEFKDGKSANSLNQCIKQLLESFKTDELKRAQLFISV
jgi:predicted ribonuclease toxin of YeeF-YezG toxin-antitoxin module